MSRNNQDPILQLILALDPGMDLEPLLSKATSLLVERLDILAGAVLDFSVRPIRILAFWPDRLTGASALDAVLASNLPDAVNDQPLSLGSNGYLWPLDGNWRLWLQGRSPFEDGIVEYLSPVVRYLSHIFQLAQDRSALANAHIDTERRSHLLEVISGINHLLLQEKNPDRLLEAACRLLVDNRGYFNAWIARLDPIEQVLSTHQSGFTTPEADLFGPMRQFLNNSNRPHCANLCLNKPGVQVIEVPVSDCFACPLATAYAGRAGLSVALRYADQNFGWLTLSTPLKFTRNPREHELIQDVADNLAFALHTLNVEARRLRQLTNSQTLSYLFAKLGSNPQDNIDRIVAQACELTDGAASLYNRLDYQKHSMLVWAGHNLPEDMPQRDAPRGHICYEATIRGQDQTIAISNLDNTEFHQSDPNVTRYGLKSYLGHPVRLNGQAIGSLAVVDVKTRQFDAEEVNIIRTLAWALSMEEERHAVLTKMEHQNRILKAIREVNHLIVHANDAESLLDQACRQLVETRGLGNAWIVLVQNGQPLAPVYHAGEKKVCRRWLTAFV